MTRLVDVPDVRVTEHAFIPLADGTRLAARIWLPSDDTPVPAILEYVPYRKRGGLEIRDEIMHRYVAARGYACVRVDLRGSGESDGILLGEYLTLEQSDGVEVVDWLSRQPWCDGSVGIIGKSWGGFNGLQIASHRPPALKAVVSVCSTDDRYLDDIHHKGGTLLTEKLAWASTMFSYQSTPPDPDLVGDDWRQIWLERLDANKPWIIEWLHHLIRDDFFRNGSVSEDFARIEVPVLAVGGWADSYTNAIFRMVRGLTSPVSAVIGPWVHVYPHQGLPGPDIDFLGMCVRWWDRWLKGIEGEIGPEPPIRVFVQDSIAPATEYAVRPGRWMAVSEWPRADGAQLHLTPLGLRSQSGGEFDLEIDTVQTLGATGGEFCPMWQGADLPEDQAPDDAGSVCFDTSPLEDGMEIIGAPELDIEFTPNAATGNLFVRVCDVAPDGSSARIGWMPFNLAHLAGHDKVEALVPGIRYRATIKLDDCAHRLLPGHRLRIALSSTYWPLVWPPTEGGVRMHRGTLRLPSAPRAVEAPNNLGVGVGAATLDHALEQPEQHTRSVSHKDDVRILDTYDNFGVERFASGLSRATVCREHYEIADNDPLTAAMTTHWTEEMKRPGWKINTETTTTMTASASHFHIKARLDAYEADSLVFSRTWDERIPRVGS